MNTGTAQPCSPNPCSEEAEKLSEQQSLVKWFFGCLPILVGNATYRREYKDAQAEEIAQSFWFASICEYTQPELERAFKFVADNGGMNFLNIGEILEAVETSRPSKYHKTFEQQKAEDIAAMRAKGIEPLEHKPCSREQNKRRMADLMSTVSATQPLKPTRAYLPTGIPEHEIDRVRAACDAADAKRISKDEVAA